LRLSLVLKMRDNAYRGVIATSVGVATKTDKCFRELIEHLGRGPEEEGQARPPAKPIRLAVVYGSVTPLERNLCLNPIFEQRLTL
jgi:hypothetical protein